VTGSAEVILFAHRGASADYTEHTRAAYLAAIAQGADGLETDVRLTADGQLVCWHDPTTDRIGGVAGWVHEFTLDELRALDLSRGREIPAEYGDASDQLMTLPALLELLMAAERPVRLALELKQPGPFGDALTEAVLTALTEAGWDSRTGALGASSVDLMCFWPQTVANLRDKVGPGLVMLLVEDAERDELLRWVEHETRGRLSGDSAERAVDEAARLRDELLSDAGAEVGVGPDRRIVARDIEAARSWVDADRPVRVWTVNKVEDALICLDAGIRELTTDRPAALRDELARY
jgi:glycerophosphoryl diester phosphodiesterase